MGVSAALSPIVSQFYSYLPPIEHLLNTQQSVDAAIRMIGVYFPEVVQLRKDINFTAEDSKHLTDVIKLVHKIMIARSQSDAVHNKILEFMGSLQGSVYTLQQQFEALNDFIFAYDIYFKARGRRYELPALENLQKIRCQLKSHLRLIPL